MTSLRRAKFYKDTSSEKNIMNEQSTSNTTVFYFPLKPKVWTQCKIKALAGATKYP